MNATSRNAKSAKLAAIETKLRAAIAERKDLERQLEAAQHFETQLDRARWELMGTDWTPFELTR